MLVQIVIMLSYPDISYYAQNYASIVCQGLVLCGQATSLLQPAGWVLCGQATSVAASWVGPV